MRSCAALVTALCLGLGHAAVARAWTPEPARYGVAVQQNVAVTMADGTVLRADVYTPTDPATGQPAAGSFPVLLTQTPYGKGLASEAGGGSASPLLDQTGENAYLVQRGYVEVVADVRGTGASGGQWGLFDPVQATDGATLVRWAAQLPHADGTVGLYGASYLGINQLFTVGALGPGSPVKAIFPIVAADDVYRDTSFDGGILDAEFGGLYLGGLTTPLFVINPVAEDPQDPFAVMVDELDHAQGAANFQLQIVADTAAGYTGYSYDEDYWRPRAPAGVLDTVVKDGVPAYLVGGWFDLFQRGEPLNYSALQNLSAGRPELAPMAPGQAPTGRYQLLMGPWYHLTTGAGVDLDQLELAWFDRWLKGEDTGIDRTSTPEHLYLLGGNRYVDAAQWPPAALKPATWYLGAGSLATSPGAAGADTVAYVGANAPCQREMDQWSMGALIALLGPSNPNSEPCANDDVLTGVGPGALTYTSAPFASDTVIGGPLDATIYATSTRPDTELVATVDDVAPDGTSTPLTTGALLGSFRAVDASQSWTAPDGRPLLPYHPYTSASQQAVPLGAPTRFDIEIRPTFAELAAGHRLRLTLSTSDLPALLPSAQQQTQLAGGVYQVQRPGSFLEVSSAPASAFPASAAPPPPTTTASSCTLSGRLSRRGLGPVRLGMTRARVRRVRAAHPFCGRLRVGYSHGRAALVLSSDPRFHLHGLRPGAKVHGLRHAHRLRIGHDRWYLTGRGVVHAWGRRVREVGVARRGVGRPLLRRFS
jgi:putative CocE/NonD family hydrolase